MTDRLPGRHRHRFVQRLIGGIESLSPALAIAKKVGARGAGTQVPIMPSAQPVRIADRGLGRAEHGKPWEAVLNGRRVRNEMPTMLAGLGLIRSARARSAHWPSCIQ